MIQRTWTSPRRLCAGLQISAVAALTLFAPVLLPSRAAFADVERRVAHEPRNQNHGDDVNVEGTLEVQIEDRPDGARYHHFLSTDDGKRWSMKGVEHNQDLLSGDRVRVKGSSSLPHMTIRLREPTGTTSKSMARGGTGSNSAALEVLAAAPLSTTFGVRKVVVILVNFSDDPRQPYTIAAARSALASVDSFYREASYGQTSLDVDVFGWYTLPMSKTACNTSQVRSYAQQAAMAAGVNLSQYGHQMFAFPRNTSSTNCQFTGWSMIGGNPSSAWINLDTMSTQIVAHEFGHSLGLYHSNALDCPAAGVAGTCEHLEYGDNLDKMGTGAGHFNAFQKQRLGWLAYGNSPPITTVQTSGTYTIATYEFPGTEPKALKIQRGTSGQSFFVELRSHVGWDTSLYESGVFLHVGTDTIPNSSYLLDMTPETGTFYDGSLEVGKSFVDPDWGVTITTLAVSSTSATISVDMNDTPCTRSAPRVTASPAQSPAVKAGTAVTYTVSVTNTDTTGCSASSVTLQATAPTTSWQKSFSASSLAPNPGATASTTLQITSPSVAPGAYTIAITATSSTDSTRSDSTSAAYNVAPDVGGTGGGPGTFADNFDRPDASGLGNGWSVTAGSVMLQSREARNQPTSLFGLAVQPGLMGATQTVAASFASTNNNSAPRFGTVVRYQDTQNYYMCYRLVGGSSLVRIAKIQNGVETVLKSAGVQNASKNAFSTLSCKASGSTLTLQLDGKALLSVNDGTFTTGGVGFSMKSKTADSHRVDNFSAIVQ